MNEDKLFEWIDKYFPAIAVVVLLILGMMIASAIYVLIEVGQWIGRH